ncbi:DAZAP1 [Cordylochernes scorpioides]|uniref:DAZAP1 n=1 Tax=Cordylochernes scorpioides TaxID=51811 RepID=A0ABY6KZ46_9ARAC|nr:DAZAP1 [Cordylochernes scorpioides]
MSRSSSPHHIFDVFRKMFVGGLSWETTEEKLKNYFKKFGDVSEVVVMRNPETNKPRGFGFVTFKDPDCVTIVLCTGPHELDGRTIDPKACSSKQAIKVSLLSLQLLLLSTWWYKT